MKFAKEGRFKHPSLGPQEGENVILTDMLDPGKSRPFSKSLPIIKSSMTSGSKKDMLGGEMKRDPTTPMYSPREEQVGIQIILSIDSLFNSFNITSYCTLITCICIYIYIIYIYMIYIYITLYI